MDRPLIKKCFAADDFFCESMVTQQSGSTEFGSQNQKDSDCCSACGFSLVSSVSGSLASSVSDSSASESLRSASQYFSGKCRNVGVTFPRF